MQPGSGLWIWNNRKFLTLQINFFFFYLFFFIRMKPKYAECLYIGYEVSKIIHKKNASLGQEFNLKTSVSQSILYILSSFNINVGYLKNVIIKCQILFLRYCSTFIALNTMPICLCFLQNTHSVFCKIMSFQSSGILLIQNGFSPINSG